MKSINKAINYNYRIFARLKRIHEFSITNR